MKILSYNGISEISRAVRLARGRKATHTAIELPDGRCAEAWLPGGFQINKSWRSLHTVGTEVKVFELKPMYLLDFDEDAAVRKVYELEGTPYDFSAIAGFLAGGLAEALDIDVEFNDPNAMICSEAVCHIIKAGGIVLQNMPFHMVCPGWLEASIALHQTDLRTV